MTDVPFLEPRFEAAETLVTSISFNDIGTARQMLSYLVDCRYSIKDSPSGKVRNLGL